MVHSEEISSHWLFVNPRWLRRALRTLLSPVLSVLPLLLAGCSDNTVIVPAPRFAQVGELRVDVQTPLVSHGRLEATVVWQSDGAWALVERIYHRGQLGGEVTRTSSRTAGLRDLAAAYASLVQQLNESPGLRLTGGQIATTAGPCLPDQSTIRVSMVDSFRNEILFWERCGLGNLFTLTAGSAGPDPEAPRIVTAAQLIRSFTIGELERSAFQGSLPFAMLSEGITAVEAPQTSSVFIGDSGGPPPGWDLFWSNFAATAGPQPDVNWEQELVLFLADGTRPEAGHHLWVRRVLPVGTQTLIEVVEGVPGDFCTPAFVTQRPYQIVRIPLVPMPVQIGQFVIQRQRCGS